jgi:hypothetical protein
MEFANMMSASKRRTVDTLAALLIKRDPFPSVLSEKVTS